MRFSILEQLSMMLHAHTLAKILELLSIHWAPNKANFPTVADILCLGKGRRALQCSLHGECLLVPGQKESPTSVCQTLALFRSETHNGHLEIISRWLWTSQTSIQWTPQLYSSFQRPSNQPTIYSSIFPHDDTKLSSICCLRHHPPCLQLIPPVVMIYFSVSPLVSWAENVQFLLLPAMSLLCVFTSFRTFSLPTVDVQFLKDFP